MNVALRLASSPYTFKAASLDVTLDANCFQAPPTDLLSDVKQPPRQAPVNEKSQFNK